MMFKILALQRYYNLSDEQMQYQILDRLSFMRFLGLTLSDRVPDEKSKLILGYEVTDASVHDSQPLEDLLNKKDKDQPMYADSAYTGEEQEKVIGKAGMINRVHEKGYKNRSLTKSQMKFSIKVKCLRIRTEVFFKNKSY